VIQSGQLSAARQVGGEKQTKQVSETAKRAALRPEGGYVDLMNSTGEGSRRMVLRRDGVEIGNSGLPGFHRIAAPCLPPESRPSTSGALKSDSALMVSPPINEAGHASRKNTLRSRPAMTPSGFPNWLFQTLQTKLLVRTAHSTL